MNLKAIVAGPHDGDPWIIFALTRGTEQLKRRLIFQLSIEVAVHISTCIHTFRAFQFPAPHSRKLGQDRARQREMVKQGRKKLPELLCVDKNHRERHIVMMLLRMRL